MSGLQESGRRPGLAALGGPLPSGSAREPRALAAPAAQLSLQDPALRLSLVQSVCMATQAICSSAHGGSFHLLRKAELVAQMVVSVGGLGRTEPPGLWGLTWGQAGASAKGCPAAALPGVHQSGAPRLAEDAHSEEGHASLHVPGVSFPCGGGGVRL